MNRVFRWTEVAALLLPQPLGTIIRLIPARVEHPRDGGMQLAMALLAGQRATYRLEVGNGQDLVVNEFAHAFEAQLELRPALREIESLMRDAPGSMVAGLIAAGAIVGLALGRSNESALVGALIGGATGMAGVRMANAEGAPGAVGAWGVVGRLPKA